jgi:uncharacterized integral membrane protein
VPPLRNRHKNYLNQKFDELSGNIKAKGNVAMKRKRLEIFGYCLVVGLFAILIVGVLACSSKTTIKLTSIEISPSSPAMVLLSS